MNIDLTTLKNRNDSKIMIDNDLVIPTEYLKQADLLGLKDVHVDGYIYLDSLGEYQISLSVNGTMIIACAITLKPVDYHFESIIEGNALELLKEIDENVRKSENTIDILPIIWENILMEIPLRVVSEDAKDIEMAGDGWKLITSISNKTETNPELEKLKDLL